MELISTVGMDNFGLLLDTFHMNIEEPIIEESIQLCDNRIFHFHVADSNRWYPGGGHLDFESILKKLHETGYKGFVSGEFLAHPDSDTAAKNNIKFLKPLINQIIN
jgi:sugar phosphate isomerase/epimerase